VAHILPSEGAGPLMLVMPSYFSPQKCGPGSKQARPQPRKPERTMSKKSKKQKSGLDSKTQDSGANGQPRIGKKENLGS